MQWWSWAEEMWRAIALERWLTLLIPLVAGIVLYSTHSGEKRTEVREDAWMFASPWHNARLALFVWAMSGFLRGGDIRLWGTAAVLWFVTQALLPSVRPYGHTEWVYYVLAFWPTLAVRVVVSSALDGQPVTQLMWVALGVGTGGWIAAFLGWRAFKSWIDAPSGPWSRRLDLRWWKDAAVTAVATTEVERVLLALLFTIATLPLIGQSEVNILNGIAAAAFCLVAFYRTQPSRTGVPKPHPKSLGYYVGWAPFVVARSSVSFAIGLKHWSAHSAAAFVAMLLVEILVQKRFVKEPPKAKVEALPHIRPDAPADGE